jgi:hypothetical protein
MLTRASVFLATGLAVVVQVLSQLLLATGPVVTFLGFCAAAGGIALLLASGAMLWREDRGNKIAFIGCLLAAAYYALGVPAALRSIVRLGAQYPVQLFVPPVLLALAALLVWRRGMQTPTASRIVAVPIGVAVVLVVPFVSIELPVPDSFFVPRRVVTLRMASHRGDSVYGRNFVRLTTTRGDKHCATDFWSRQDFADYASSHSQSVPTTYEVLYDQTGEAVSANFRSVGHWKSSDFGPNEGNIGSFGTVTVGQTLVTRTPQDCFATLR